MPYKTVNLRPHTYERLKTYQVRGKSLSDVIEDFMDSVAPEAVYQEALAVHRERMERIRREGGLTLADVEDEPASEG